MMKKKYFVAALVAVTFGGAFVSAVGSPVEEPQIVSAAKKKVLLKLDSVAFYPDSKGAVKVTGTSTPGAKVKLGLVGSVKVPKTGKFSLEASSKKIDKKVTVTAKLHGRKTNKKKITIKKSGSISPAATAEIKTINDALAKDLAQSQGWANGKLDENGNPSDNATPNAAFAWSNSIDSVTINANHIVTAQATNAVLALSKTDQRSLAEHVAKSSLAVLIELNKASDSEINAGRLFTSLKVGKRYVSHY